MVLFILRKLILQMCMCSHPVGLDVWFLIGPFVYPHTSWVGTATALARLRGCAGSPEPSLIAYVIRTVISWAGSNSIFGLSFWSCLSCLTSLKEIYHSQRWLYHNADSNFVLVNLFLEFSISLSFIWYINIVGCLTNGAQNNIPKKMCN